MSNSQKDLVVEARELLASIDKSRRVGYAFDLLRQLCDEVERARKALNQMVTLWDEDNPDDSCFCSGASDDCRYPPTCELCVARMVVEGRNPASE